ncbi:MAG: NTP transferase domain-containing protein [Pseudomonadota bacterium]
MLAVIIAAGLGQRLGDLTKDRPKALVKVVGRELILRAFDFLDHPAITDRIVVTGYEGERLASFIKEKCHKVKTVHNPNYRDGSIRTIETALPFIEEDFLLMNVDHIYPQRMFGHIIESAQEITAMCDFDRTLGSDDMKVKLGEDGCLKGIRKTLSEYDGGYIGMTFCSNASLTMYKHAVCEARKSEGNAAAVESALALMTRTNTKINICDVSGMGWLEVDTPADLEIAEKTITDNPTFIL